MDDMDFHRFRRSVHKNVDKLQPAVRPAFDLLMQGLLSVSTEAVLGSDAQKVKIPDYWDYPMAMRAMEEAALFLGWAYQNTLNHKEVHYPEIFWLKAFYKTETKKLSTNATELLRFIQLWGKEHWEGLTPLARYVPLALPQGVSRSFRLYEITSDQALMAEAVNIQTTKRRGSLGENFVSQKPTEMLKRRQNGHRFFTLRDGENGSYATFETDVNCHVIWAEHARARTKYREQEFPYDKLFVDMIFGGAAKDKQCASFIKSAGKKLWLFQEFLLNPFEELPPYLRKHGEARLARDLQKHLVRNQSDYLQGLSAVSRMEKLFPDAKKNLPARWWDREKHASYCLQLDALLRPYYLTHHVSGETVLSLPEAPFLQGRKLDQVLGKLFSKSRVFEDEAVQVLLKAAFDPSATQAENVQKLGHYILSEEGATNPSKPRLVCVLGEVLTGKILPFPPKRPKIE